MNKQPENGFTLRPGVREAVSLLIGLIGPSGGGKTYTAMRLAKGICGAKPFAVIDTEAGRAKHYADLFKFDHGDLRPPFRPDAYANAIKVADEAGYRAIIVDSFSQEWAGEDGVLDWQEAELQRMAGDDWQKREACKMASWIKPKMGHKHMIQKLLQVRSHLILCFRAEEKIEMKKGEDGKMRIIPRGYQPICEKGLPFELTVSFMLTPDKPGIPQPIKLQEQHKALFLLNQQIDEESGRKISEWAAGGIKTETIQKKEDFPSPEEERQALEEKGMIPNDDAAILNQFPKEIAKFTKKKELTDWYNQNRSAWKKDYSAKEFLEITRLVNDKLEKLKQ